METYIGIGNGQKEDQKVLASAAVKSGVPTAENLTAFPSTKSQKDKENLTGRDVLSILENGFWRLKEYCQTPVKIMATDDSIPVIAILPKIIRYCQKCGHLRLSEDMLDDMCRYCQP